MSVAIPEPAESALAEEALHGLGSALRSDAPVRLRLEVEGGDVVVPRSALPALAQVLAALAQGEAVTVLPAHAELTTQQAANALNVSRPYLIGLLDAGQIEYRKVGTHRRVSASSLVEYMRADDATRLAAADALSAETVELGFV